jgi:ComF family protein
MTGDSGRSPRCFPSGIPFILTVLPAGFSRRVVFSSTGDLNRVYGVSPHTRIWREEMGRALYSAAASLFAVLFPSDCRICRSALTEVSKLPVCEDCLGRIRPLAGTLCSVCGEKLLGARFAGEADPLCDLCRRAAPRFRRAVAYGAYEGALRDLLHLFKYQGVRSAAPLLGRLLGRSAIAAGIEGPFLVVPIPLAAGKRRARGFNQAEEIARAFCAASCALGAAGGIQLESALLVRKRETVSQTGLTRPQRQANLRGAFAVTAPEKLRGKSILLVDDVMTTGATAGECARIMLKSGAKEVLVATVARATRDAESVLSRAAVGFLGGTTGHA